MFMYDDVFNIGYIKEILVYLPNPIDLNRSTKEQA